MMIRRAMLASMVALIAGAAVAQQSPPPTRVRGEITGYSDRALNVATREGDKVTIKLAEGFSVIGVTKADITDIKSNSFVGIAAIKGTDGNWVALEVLVFPESARGAGEGHYPWDLQPQSTMTNGTVATVAEAAHGRTLKVAYKGAAQPIEITVPTAAPIVTFATGSPDLLKPGNHLFASATKGAGGDLTAARVLVGVDGLVPPM
ncbi:hypothetical protein [Reyranella sp. CPCC 100927]|uniref:hypothetical protein n=1 Tax=Reyranella sp. CPCC 100927 TaxID=2599616 RepID=UPI0011B3B7E4|nr:hypothetical protein [Reyranella sp. CPCC 100927]TWT05164.1 hypothetical protein FQU96_26350 [Reyranella sp. CPCC 100927]